jgi:hypothetical protein
LAWSVQVQWLSVASVSEAEAALERLSWMLDGAVARYTAPPPPSALCPLPFYVLCLCSFYVLNNPLPLPLKTDIGPRPAIHSKAATSNGLAMRPLDKDRTSLSPPAQQIPKSTRPEISPKILLVYLPLPLPIFHRQEVQGSRIPTASGHTKLLTLLHFCGWRGGSGSGPSNAGRHVHEKGQSRSRVTAKRLSTLSATPQYQQYI